MKKFLNNIILKIQRFYQRLFVVLIFNNCKVKNDVIVFESEGDYCDNARALYEYLIKNNYNKKYSIVWIVKNVKKYRGLNNGVSNVSFVSRENKNPINMIKFNLIIGRAKYFFFTHPYWFTYKKSDQIIINLWHGTPLKSGGRDISNTFDYGIVPSENIIPLYEKFIGIKKSQVVIMGLPRNDLLFEKNNSIQKLLNKKKINKTVIYMPTFRQTKYQTDSSIINKYVLFDINTEDDLKKLSEYLIKTKIDLIIKIHHLQFNNYIKNIHLSNIHYICDDDLNQYDIQLYNLLGSCDALLTDYSSVYFDYLLTDKPIGFFVSDIEDYKKNRGFLLENVEDYMPGKKMKNIADLYKFLNNISAGEDEYKEERKKIREFSNYFVDANNCERVVDYFLKDGIK